MTERRTAISLPWKIPATVVVDSSTGEVTEVRVYMNDIVTDRDEGQVVFTEGGDPAPAEQARCAELSAQAATTLPPYKLIYG